LKNIFEKEKEKRARASSLDRSALVIKHDKFYTHLLHK